MKGQRDEDPRLSETNLEIAANYRRWLIGNEYVLSSVIQFWAVGHDILRWVISDHYENIMSVRNVSKFHKTHSDGRCGSRSMGQ